MMAQAANIVLADALATPVNHTFIPLGPMDKWDMVYEDQSQASPVGFWRIYTRIQRPSGKQAGGAVKIEISLREPVLEAIAPAASGLTQPPTVAFEPRCDFLFLISDRSSAQTRKDLRKMANLLLADSQVVAMVENFIGTW